MPLRASEKVLTRRVSKSRHTSPSPLRGALFDVRSYSRGYAPGCLTDARAVPRVATRRRRGPYVYARSVARVPVPAPHATPRLGACCRPPRRRVVMVEPRERVVGSRREARLRRGGMLIPAQRRRRQRGHHNDVSVGVAAVCAWLIRCVARRRLSQKRSQEPRLSGR